MTGSLSAGIAWAVPVKPDVLGAHLEAYEKALPIINALRLCHRFGQGPNAHLTKIPVELEQAIEEFVLIAKRPLGSGWQTEFKCFECKCEPAEHSEIPDWAYDAASEQLDRCEGCEANGIDDDACENRCTKGEEDVCIACKDGSTSRACMQTCLAAFGELADDITLESDFYLEEHNENRNDWRLRVKQGRNGSFHRYDKLLYKHFGLEAYFAHTRVDALSAQSWPTHYNDQWHESGRRETTLCYLTLPQHFGKDSRFETTDIEDEAGFVSMPCAQVLDIDVSALTGTTKMRTQFQRAMRVLDLKPLPHSSQGFGSVSGAEQPNAEAKKDVVQKREVKDGDASHAEWPRLVMLVRGMFNFQ